MARLTLINSTLLALALLASGPAAAQESPGARAALVAANAVGHWIADQGNQALRDIREDLRENLRQALKPMLPAPAQAAAPMRQAAATPATAGAR